MADTDSSSRPLCFVVGPIGKDGTIERKHADLLLHSVIKHVLENDEFKYKVKRADEDADPGMIGDRVVSDIINSHLVVADLTDLNPNAFYELGIRHSTEKPTIHMAKFGTVLPFDNVAHRTIFVDLMDWHSIEAARLRLAESARAVKSAGYKVSNPITQANASFRMRQSEDPRDRLLAELQERLASIEASIARPDARPQERLSPRQRMQQERSRRHSALVTEIERVAKAKKEDGWTKDAIERYLNEHVEDFEDVRKIEFTPEGLGVTFANGDIYVTVD